MEENEPLRHHHVNAIGPAVQRRDEKIRRQATQFAGRRGCHALDDAIKNGVLTGLQLQEPPPAGMKLPIVLRLTAQRQTR